MKHLKKTKCSNCGAAVMYSPKILNERRVWVKNTQKPLCSNCKNAKQELH